MKFSANLWREISKTRTFLFLGKSHRSHENLIDLMKVSLPELGGLSDLTDRKR